MSGGARAAIELRRSVYTTDLAAGSPNRNPEGEIKGTITATAPAVLDPGRSLVVPNLVNHLILVESTMEGLLPEA